MDNPYAISDSFWLALKDPCPGKVGDRGRTARDNRLFVDAVVYVTRVGMIIVAKFCKWRSVAPLENPMQLIRK